MIAKDKIKPFVLLFLCMAGWTFYFWTTSRYPDLGAKAALGGTAPLSGLGFAPLFEIKPEFALWEKLFYGTLNWLETNRRGMTFAFILGAFFLSMIPLLNIKRAKTALGNAFLGLVMGTPLGLCVNCSSPVARAMQASGMRLEAALALLISSPTMNIVVLTMAFTFFPFYLVVGKILFTLLFVLAIIPLACHSLFQKEVVRNNTLFNKIEECADEKDCAVPEIKGWVHAVLWSVVTYIKNFIRIVIVTGPLMILAGFVGTLIITFLPWAEIRALKESVHDPLTMGGIMALIAFVGALLPSPMAFDVAMSAFLLQAGVPIIYVAVFLFTLGSYSVYAFFIVWQAISLRVASFLMVVTIVLGLLMGMSALVFEGRYMQEAAVHVEAQAVAAVPEDLDPVISRTDEALSYEALRTEIEQTKVVFEDVAINNTPENLKVEWVPFVAASPMVENEKPFTRVNGDDLGIVQPYRISYLNGIDVIPRITTSVATGDVHNDGWEDVLILGDHDVRPNVILYSNMEGKGFKRQSIPAAEDAVLVSLVDLNGDGWLDIVYATFNGKNYVVYNDKGEFTEANRKPLGEDLPGTTNSMSFGDLNRDGQLEIFLGNWSVGPGFLNNSLSKDMLLTRHGEDYKATVLQGLSGETLTSMFWDFNKDGHLDLYIGNDFIASYISDLILLGDGKGGLELPPADFAKTFPGAQSTMSMDVGDINNDLKPEFYIGQIAYIGQYMRKMSQISKRQIRYEDYCAIEGTPDDKMHACQDEVAFKMALAKVTHFVSDACNDLKNETHKKMCEIHLLNYKKNCFDDNQSFERDGSWFATDTRYAKMCLQLQKARGEQFSIPIPEDIRARHLEVANESSSNILLFDKEGNGQFTDIAKDRGVGYGGWTWNAKFADLDNDGWEDIYVTNGYPTPMAAGTKVFYRNKGDGVFEDMTGAFGLEDYSATAAYSYVDYDHDGDLDILAVPLDGAVEIFRNNSGAAQSALQIELRDHSSANVFAIGAKITIGSRMRVVKASGGYKSFDAPVLYFGLGKDTDVEQIEIEWPDGKKDVLDGDFKTGGRYRISRS